jgi:acyl-CoA hydrolase
MGIGDANIAGNVHGGVIMRLCDEVAGIAAVRHSGQRVVTAAMDRMNFLHPVYVGQLVTLKATVNAAWRTSMEVGVRVESENVRTGELVHTSTAYLTMVALDDEGSPAAVPPLSRRPRWRGVAPARHSSAGTTAWPSGSGSRPPARPLTRGRRPAAPRTEADATP